MNLGARFQNIGNYVVVSVRCKCFLIPILARFESVVWVRGQILSGRRDSCRCYRVGQRSVGGMHGELSIFVGVACGFQVVRIGIVRGEILGVEDGGVHLLEDLSLSLRPDDELSAVWEVESVEGEVGGGVEVRDHREVDGGCHEAEGGVSALAEDAVDVAGEGLGVLLAIDGSRGLSLEDLLEVVIAPALREQQGIDVSDPLRKRDGVIEIALGLFDEPFELAAEEHPADDGMPFTAVGRIVFVGDGEGEGAVDGVAVLVVERDSDGDLFAFAVGGLVEGEIAKDLTGGEDEEGAFGIDVPLVIDDGEVVDAGPEVGIGDTLSGGAFTVGGLEDDFGAVVDDEGGGRGQRNTCIGNGNRNA